MFMSIKRGFWHVKVCLCNCSKSAKKRAPLTQKETAHAYMSVVCFNGLKSQCLKTRDHATDPSFRNELLVVSWLVVLHLLLPPFTPRGGRRIKITVNQMKKRYYRKQCILRYHEINDRTKYETIYFLFRPSDIYRHIAQPLFIFISSVHKHVTKLFWMQTRSLFITNK